ncbi:MAG: nucleotide sugar dehydrogenase [Myxococcaceae bacterium]|nr:nucleotide sugar dehydrogenase [Myxococcaceae bacterium]MBH2006136.1 nucleotide sugar dehydrogenase [Myxococcaceae bacterium]
MKTVVSVIGLGYVGLPLALEFAKHFETVGFDLSIDRIEELRTCFDRTEQTSVEELQETTLKISSDPEVLVRANFHVITVPTPIDSSRNPDLTCLISASQLIGTYLKKGDTVVYESTVYPGLTEEDCLPILERASGLQAGQDFQLGYSPERVNPGDPVHALTHITKVVSGIDSASLNRIAEVYSKAIKAGVYRAPTIKTAEAAKVIENTQRDLNVALMNELAVIFHKMDIDTGEVLKAAQTKWNFLPFKPGLVGGHCISVDPYYLTHKAQALGYHPEVILAGRRINDQMGAYVAQQTILQMIHQGISIKNAQVGILGITFKENCPDIRNTKVVDMINELHRFGIKTFVHDPMAYREEVLLEYSLELIDWDQMPRVGAFVLAVAHDQYKNLETNAYLKKLEPNGLVIDVKGILAPTQAFPVWRL